MSPFVFALRLIVLYGVFHGAYLLVPDAVLATKVYPILTGAPSAAVIQLLAPTEQPQVTDNRLHSPRAILEIVRGCDGSGVWFLLSAAVLAFPSSLRMKLLGLVLGTVMVFALNVVRIAGLYFVVAYRPQAFLPLHTYFIPTLLIVMVAAFFLWWVNREKPADA